MVGEDSGLDRVIAHPTAQLQSRSRRVRREERDVIRQKRRVFPCHSGQERPGASNCVRLGVCKPTTQPVKSSSRRALDSAATCGLV